MRAVLAGAVAVCGAAALSAAGAAASAAVPAARAAAPGGSWGKAIEVPGLGALNAGGSAEVDPLSCPSAGHCTAGGSFRGLSGHRQGFVTQIR